VRAGDGGLRSSLVAMVTLRSRSLETGSKVSNRGEEPTDTLVVSVATFGEVRVAGKFPRRFGEHVLVAPLGDGGTGDVCLALGPDAEPRALKRIWPGESLGKAV